ncbi:MAG: hypothetical protein ACTTHM_04650 [Peptoanaerobacter stomatis]|uniref:hypothetical protein n=1 Tax=Peptoanaerobacter stomatis TaxID=796937 RepID=UPI003FA16B9C
MDNKEEKKKMGRPTNNPKPYRAVVRMDEKTNSILNNYCDKEKINKMEGIRRGIQELEKYL